MGGTSNKKRVSHEVTKVHIKENLLFFVFFVASCENCFSWVANLAVLFKNAFG